MANAATVGHNSGPRSPLDTLGNDLGRISQSSFKTILMPIDTESEVPSYKRITLLGVDVFVSRLSTALKSNINALDRFCWVRVGYKSAVKTPQADAILKSHGTK